MSSLFTQVRRSKDNQGHPTTVFCKESVRRSKYCLEFYIALNTAKNFSMSVPFRYNSVSELIQKFPYHFLKFNFSYFTLCLKLIFVEKGNLKKKPPIVNQQKVVYYFNCGLCGADYVGFMSRHLHKHVEEHKRSTKGKYVRNEHGKDPRRPLQTISKF